ncbi:MAG: UxaA family hydrolase [Pseudomonadota bacterium]
MSKGLRRLIQTGHIADASFDPCGFARAHGAFGVRNYLLILNLTGLTEMAARRAADQLSGAVFVSFPYGMGMVGDDLAASTRMLTGLATNPNIGAIVFVSADRSRLTEIAEASADAATPSEEVCLDAVGHDAVTLTSEIVQAGAKLMREASFGKRSKLKLSDLCIGVECGLSDTSSGIAANRVVGGVTDQVVAAGGTVIMGETLEWLGVENQLADRAETKEVASAICNAVARRENRARSEGVDLLGINPNRRNIEEGLSTIEEKASGSIAKSGSAPITGLLDHGEAPTRPGLWLMDQPSYSPESLTGYAAAGAQIALFTTGSGNSYTSAIMPTIKVTANTKTARTRDTQIDFDCSPVMTGADLKAAVSDLLEQVFKVASGMLTFGEILGEGNEVFSRFGEAL